MSGKMLRVGKRWWFMNFHGRHAPLRLWGVKRYGTHTSALFLWCELSWGGPNG